MSYKRKHGEMADASSSTTAPFKKHRSFKPAGSDQPHKRKRPQVSNDLEKSTSIHALKSRIRDLKRLLVHVDHVGDHKMSASTRIERERELEACEHELEEKIESTREAEYKKKMIGKYHQVRFFDRQKATRILKKLKKEHSAEEDPSKRVELKQRIRNAEVDVNYAIYYPLMKPYSSLYPKTKESKSADAEDEDSDSKDKGSDTIDGPKGDVDTWRAVEKATEENTLKTLRYSNESLPAAVPKKEKKTFVKPKEPKEHIKVLEGRNRRERRAHGAQLQEAEEDSDGGFFE